MNICELLENTVNAQLQQQHVEDNSEQSKAQQKQQQQQQQQNHQSLKVEQSSTSELSNKQQLTLNPVSIQRSSNESFSLSSNLIDILSNTNSNENVSKIENSDDGDSVQVKHEDANATNQHSSDNKIKNEPEQAGSLLMESENDEESHVDYNS
jgi:hypothetical protein